MSVFNNKDKLEYFKNNVQGSEDQKGEFDPSQYYYNRESGVHDSQQSLTNGYNLDNYGGQNMTQLQRQQLQQQQALRNQQSPSLNSLGQDSLYTNGTARNIQQVVGGLGSLSLNGTNNSVYNGSGIVGNRSIGDLSSTTISNSSRVISSSNNGANSQSFDSTSFPSLSATGGSSLLMGGARPYSAVAQLGASGLGSLNREDFNAQSEDFPALPGSGTGSSLINKGGNSDQIVGNNVTSGENKLGVPGGSTNNGSQVLSQGANNMFSGNVLGDTTQDSAQPSHSLLSGIASSTPHTTAVTKEQKFGLMGLLDVIRYTDKDINTLALGTDLTTFGLNLNSSDSLFPSFSSPFTDMAQVPEPQFNTPACYMMHPPSLKSEHLSKFQIETLFYMFYAMPKDILQACASQELYRRDWRYHAELRIWLKPRAPQELMQSHPNVQFVFFDSGAWETRLFTTPHRGNIAAGLLSEEEVRVKAPQPNNSIPLGGSQ